MNPLLPRIAAGVLALAPLAALAAAAATASKSDLVSPEKRRVTVELAQHLTRAPEPRPVPADLANPFNPVGFDQPDPEEVRQAALAYQKAGGGGAPAPNAPPRAPGDREILERLAALLPTSGTMMFNGEPLLILTGGRVKIGDRFTVSDKSTNQDYELELTAIDRTTFTLRYHGEEIVRPIHPGK